MMKTMILDLVAIGTAAAGLAIGGAASFGNGSDELPRAVRDGILRAYPGAELGASERDSVKITVYEVEIRHAGTELDVLVSSDGTVVLSEQDVAREQLPAAVAEILDRLGGAAQVDEIERTDRRARPGFVPLGQVDVSYEVEWTRDGREIDVRIASDGSLLDNGGEEEGEEEHEDEDR